MKQNHNKTLIIIGLVVLVSLGIVTRLIQHEPNFTAIGALALMSGFLFRFKHGYLVPLVALFISDLVIGFYTWPIMMSVYGSFVLIYFLGRAIQSKQKFSWLVSGSLAGSALFFLLTNWTVWAFSPMYAPTLAGLLESYYLALPFFRNTLMGDLFYIGIILSAYELVIYLASIKKQEIRFSSLTSYLK